MAFVWSNQQFIIQWTKHSRLNNYPSKMRANIVMHHCRY